MTKVSIDTINNTKRPSHRERTRKIRQAKEAVLESNICVVDQVSIASDALQLGYLVKDIASVLSDILEEITPGDYVGKSPPERSYEDKIKGSELFALKWARKRFGCDLYLKFTLKGGVMWLVSFHQDR